MNKLFCPALIPKEIVSPLPGLSIDFWNKKYYPRIVSENLKPHNLYVMPDVHQLPYQNLKRYFLEEFQLLVKSIILFPTIPNMCKDPHRDGPRNSYSYSAINIPVLNVENSHQIWWPEFDENRVIEYRLTNSDGTKAVGFDVVPTWSEAEYDNVQNDCKLELLTPHIVNTNVIHGVDNRNNNNWRLVLSVRFTGNPTLEEVQRAVLKKPNYI